MENVDLFGIAIAVVILGVAFFISRRVKDTTKKDKDVSRYNRIDRTDDHEQER